MHNTGVLEDGCEQVPGRPQKLPESGISLYVFLGFTIKRGRDFKGNENNSSLDCELGKFRAYHQAGSVI